MRRQVEHAVAAAFQKGEQLAPGLAGKALADAAEGNVLMPVEIPRHQSFAGSRAKSSLML